MNKPIADIAHPKMLLDPYAAWAVKEGVPITEDFGVDLLEVPTAPWPRFGIDGGLVHLKGRGDFVSIFVLELAPGAKSAPQKHLFEEVVYVLSGHGNTTIETSDGRKHSFEWGPKSLFALPLNARYQHFNSSGREHARLASTNNLALMLNLFHNDTFVFDNDYDFPERQGAATDLAGFELKTWEQRGAGGSNMMFILADGTMHAHTSQMPVGTYKKAHRHGPDFHVFAVTGHGFSLLWYEGTKDLVRIDWRHGWVFAPPDQMFHQHFNSSGREHARLASTNNLALMLNLFHNDTFVFDNDYDFPERQGAARAPGPAHPRNLSRGARQARRDVRHGKVHRRAALRQGSGLVRWV